MIPTPTPQDVISCPDRGANGSYRTAGSRAASTPGTPQSTSDASVVQRVATVSDHPVIPARAFSISGPCRYTLSEAEARHSGLEPTGIYPSLRKIIVSRNDAFATIVERRTVLAAATRLGLATAVALMPALTALTVRAQPPCSRVTTVRIQEWTGDIINIVPWVADAKGLFKKHCLDVKFVTLVSGPGSITALVSGSIEFANGAPDNIIRPRSKGVDVRVTSNMYVGQWSALVAGNQVALPHLREGYPAIMHDLAGKKIGVTVLAATTEAYVRSAFEGAGISASGVTYVAVGGVTTAVPALSAGLVDAAITGGVFPEIAEALGAGRIVLDYRKKGVGPETVQALRGATLCWNAYGPYI